MPVISLVSAVITVELPAALESLASLLAAVPAASLVYPRAK
jgi:hypothetical protein